MEPESAGKIYLSAIYFSTGVRLGSISSNNFSSNSALSDNQKKTICEYILFIFYLLYLGVAAVGFRS